VVFLLVCKLLYLLFLKKFQGGPLSGLGGPADGSLLGQAVTSSTSQQVDGDYFLISSLST
jgi:hypothetical protein